MTAGCGAATMAVDGGGAVGRMPKCSRISIAHKIERKRGHVQESKLTHTHTHTHITHTHSLVEEEATMVEVEVLTQTYTHNK